jgi:Helix-turn-helix of DDE superfamily endonuclease
MNYETVKTLSDDDFKRATGVQRSTFEKMRMVVENGSPQFGRPTALSRADQLWLTLMYWREYRTEFHIGLTYGVREATVCRTIQKVETALLRSGQFQLPGKKALHANDTLMEVVLIDATEQPIERPKKNNRRIIAAKRSVIPKKRK